jgi:pimeloyl-ACP methyl ester carboxylesterase
MRRLPLLLAVLLLALPASAAAAELHPCANIDGAQCGSIRVPLDRLDPSSNARLRIGFELYPHTEANRPSLGTLVFMEGGPGYSTTASRDWYLDLARNLTARRDVLLVDARGTGRSGALDCPALQSYTGDYLDNARRCAQQLGGTATLYGSGNAAEDLVAVLDELAIQRIDLYGDSYGSFNAQTFAVRHPERVRSLTLDGAYPIAGLDPWYPDTTRALARAFRLTCGRSAASCPVAQNNADNAIASFAGVLAAHPVSGTAPDADGVQHEVEGTVDSLISTASAADSQTVVYRELLATKAALNAGDAAPLLRLIAETTYWGDGGPVREYSEAHYLAVACHDYPWAYDLRQPTAVRLQQLAAARVALPQNLFYPFPRDDWATSSWMSYDLCVTWPAPLHDDPPLPAGRAYPSVPTLVLNGDLDQRTSSEGARRVAAAFPASTFVEVANLGHVTALNDFDGCTEQLVRGFWQSLTVPDAGCAQRDYSPIRVASSFPRRLDDVAGTWSSGTAPLKVRRAAVLAAATAADVTWRWQSMLGSEGVGLRGGTFSVDGDATAVFTLAGYRLAENLGLTGEVRWNRKTGAVTANVTLAGAVTGTLKLAWADDRPGTTATATGKVDGTTVNGAFAAP